MTEPQYEGGRYDLHWLAEEMDADEDGNLFCSGLEDGGAWDDWRFAMAGDSESDFNTDTASGLEFAGSENYARIIGAWGND